MVRSSRTKSHLPGHSPPASQAGRRVGPTFWPSALLVISTTAHSRWLSLLYSILRPKLGYELYCYIVKSKSLEELNINSSGRSSQAEHGNGQQSKGVPLTGLFSLSPYIDVTCTNTIIQNLTYSFQRRKKT
jgi:hypothetical protein